MTILSDDSHYYDSFVQNKGFYLSEVYLKTRFHKHFSQRKTSSSEESTALNSYYLCSKNNISVISFISVGLNKTGY